MKPTKSGPGGVKAGRFNLPIILFFVGHLISWAALSCAPGAVPAGDELPLNTRRLGDRVLVAWVGDHMQTIDVVALSTARGLVVIETNLLRSADVRIRRTIEREFGREDFQYLINTHHHHDHTAGNQVYADATIVGHRAVPEGMRGELTGEGLVKLIEMFKDMSEEWGEAFKQAEPDSRDFDFLREGLVLLGRVIPELQMGFVPSFPTVTFEKNLFLDMGDMTLELYSFAGLHSTSDIVVFVPEEGLVAIGDLTPEPVLPYLRKENAWDLDVILENWGRIVDGGREIKHLNMAHSDMELTVETFREQYWYFRTLRDGLREMHLRGATLEDAKRAFTIENDFPYFKDKRLEIRGQNIHEYNIEAIWERIGSGAPRGPRPGSAASE